MTRSRRTPPPRIGTATLVALTAGLILIAAATLTMGLAR